MKKITGLLAVLILSITLVGCGGNSQTTTVCELKQEGFSLNEILIANGDKVQKETTNIVMATENFTKIAGAFDVLKNTDGVVIDISESGTDTILTLEVDYAIADLDKLVEVGIITSTVDGKKVDFVSLKAIISALEKQGATCTKK